MAYKYIKKRGDYYFIVNKEGKTLSKHTSRAKAEAAFRAMERSIHAKRR